jgi:hypothetical protein
MAVSPPQIQSVSSARQLALGAALLTVCLWASAFVGIRYAGRDLSPGPLALARCWSAAPPWGR